MSPEKFIKYSVPFFVLAIISRSIEEISFFYYAVPVMCVFYVAVLIGSKQPSSLPVRQTGLQLDEGTLTSKVRSLSFHLSFRQSPESDIRHPVSGIKRFSIIIHQPSSLFHFPFLLFLLPGLWFLLTSLWSIYPEVSAARALYFILISTGCISAGVLWTRYSGRNIFEFLIPANFIIVLICLFSILTNIPSDSWTAGHGKGFIGFFGHQNLLASVLLFTLPAVLGLKIKDKSQPPRASLAKSGKIKGRKVFFIILLSLNLLMLTLTYSRSAILALIFGVIVFLILNRSWKMLAYSFVTIAVLGIITYSIPPLNQFADKIIKKDFPEVYSSRLWMWEPSYRAALEGGLFGLGYGVSHPEIRSGEYSDRFEDGRLIREKGNSSLALVEEAGVIGLILFILPIIYLLIKLPDTRPCLPAGRYLIPDVKNLSGIQNPASSILLASLTAFILHAQFEAWWVGVGSVQLPLFFVYLGLTIHKETSDEIGVRYD